MKGCRSSKKEESQSRHKLYRIKRETKYLVAIEGVCQGDRRGGRVERTRKVPESSFIAEE